MQLFYSSTSPFCRKVLILAEEVGVRDRIELVTAVLSPVQRDAGVSEKNPLGKIPTLVTDDGHTLYDSHVIAEYLDSLHQGRRMIPEGASRLRTLHLEALADGVLDAGILVRYELILRPEDKRWPEWIDGQLVKVRRGLGELERSCDSFPEELDLARIAVGCAIGWLEFREVIPELKEAFPKLYQEYLKLLERPSFDRTRPHV